MITKLKAKYVIGYDGNKHIMYENGELVYEGDSIIYVGKDYKGKVDEEIDHGNSIISPGFIDLDALGDVDHALITNELAPEMKKEISWAEEYFENDRKEWMTEEEEAFKSLYAYSHLIMNGITTAMPITSVNYKKAGETYEEIEAAAHNAGKLGLRVYLGPSYVSAMHVYDKDGNMKINWMEEEGKEGLKRAVKFIEKFHGSYDGLINGALVPERIELQTEEILKETKKYSEKLNCPIRMHAAQGEFEYNEILKKSGKSSIGYLKDIGFLDKNVSIPHVIYASGYSELDDKSNDDLDILKETGASVIHCPVVYSRSGTALESFGRYIRQGVNMSMGTDTFPPDMIRNISVGSILGMHVDNGKVENHFNEFFNAATLGGAKALGREDLGRLEKGAKADIIVIDLSAYHIGVIDDPLRTIALSATGRDVTTTIINGKVVMKDRIIHNLDYDELQEKAQRYYDKNKASYLKRSMTNLREEEIFKPSFEIVE